MVRSLAWVALLFVCAGCSLLASRSKYFGGDEGGGGNGVGGAGAGGAAAGGGTGGGGAAQPAAHVYVFGGTRNPSEGGYPQPTADVWRGTVDHEGKLGQWENATPLPAGHDGVGAGVWLPTGLLVLSPRRIQSLGFTGVQEHTVLFPPGAARIVEPFTRPTASTDFAAALTATQAIFADTWGDSTEVASCALDAESGAVMTTGCSFTDRLSQDPGQLVVARSQLFMIGTMVERAPITATGLGSFSPEEVSTSGGAVIDRPTSGFATCASDDWLFIVGGGLPTSDLVLQADLQPLDTTNQVQWSTGKAPGGLASSTCFVLGDHLFILGGTVDGPTPGAYVSSAVTFRAAIGNGTLGDWEEMALLPEARTNATTVVVPVGL